MDTYGSHNHLHGSAPSNGGKEQQIYDTFVYYFHSYVAGRQIEITSNRYSDYWVRFIGGEDILVVNNKLEYVATHSTFAEHITDMMINGEMLPNEAKSYIQKRNQKECLEEL